MNPLGLFLEPPGPLLTHLHTVYLAYSERLPTRLNPLAERTCFSQVLRHRPPALAVRQLLAAWPGAIFRVTAQGNTALHLALQNGAPADVSTRADNSRGPGGPMGPLRTPLRTPETLSRPSIFHCNNPPGSTP